MAVTKNIYTADGSTVRFSFTFPYLERTDIRVLVNGTPTTAFTFFNSSTIELATAPAAGSKVEIQRSTDDSRLKAEFLAGSAIRGADLKRSFQQTLFISQETKNNVADAVGGSIPDGAVSSDKIADGSITSAKLADSAITSEKIADGAIVNADVNVNAGIASSKLAFLQSGTGATSRTVESRLRDTVNVKDFGAVGDGVADDTAAINNAHATGKQVYYPFGTYKTTIATPRALPGRGFGPGVIVTADNNKTTGWFNKINTKPTAGNTDSSETAFNGDFSRSFFPVKQYILGANTLGKPVDTYGSSFETTPHFTYVYNESGWNESTDRPIAGQTGRTGAYAYSTFVFNNGQGDLVCYNANAYVTGTRPGSTNWLANPAAVLFNGQCNAGANYVYLNPYETYCKDFGYDVACVGVVNNFERTNATGGQSTVWLGYRAQSKGTARLDAIFTATGQWVTGLDFTMANLDFLNKAAISLKANDRIYLNNNANASGNLVEDWRTTTFNGDYMEYNSAGGFIQFVRGGTSRLQITNAQVSVVNSVLKVSPNGTGSDASTLNAIRTGFGYPTGTVNTAAFNTGTVTLTQLAQYVAGLVQALHSSTSGAHALIST